MPENNGVRANAGKDSLLVSLRNFIRTKGNDYLDDPNVSSIGIGYKQVDGRPTDDISIQFTVNEKVSEPEAVDGLETSSLPATIVVDGVEVPTDVLERRFAPSFRVVAEAVAPQRKTRLDPIMPGISVGNVHASAGTIGCIVYDRETGAPYVLSNWHVLHTAEGALGDDVVQPGPRDDNRVDRNRLGALVRSHLGNAGDCAVAGIDGRRFDGAISRLGITPDTLGDPELGDRVVKSGRTTEVTHGIVRRVDVIANIDYRGVGTRAIGGFEIGPDPDILSSDGEISGPGDSGSAWLFTLADGSTSKVLAGLHFAGETAGSTDEHALACLPESVFEKLGITLTPPAAEEAVVIAGYDPGFLSSAVPAPDVDAQARTDIATALDGTTVLHYTHFSLTVRRSRRFAMWVAWNIDGAALKKISRKKLDFVKDARLPAQEQVGNELYRDNRLDRGHIARRADLVWGSMAEAAKANKDSFFYTNISPQMDDFNQSMRHGIWGRLEDAIFAEVDVDDLRVSVFGGPVFAADDREFRGVRIPRAFWKVIAYVEQSELKARGFVLSQNLEQLEMLDLDEFRVFQVPLADIEQRTLVRFPQALRAADLHIAAEESPTPLESLSDIRW
ncbi:DNA/RNA non-specific endonuclease [Nocardia bovistercoris]|uniref:DNA/RNA non-specific endonuclease n=1 Tax=Nocardia bovistercoris TaxID=2785916 RepID=A0A931IIB3_9NOCA|nr:DNA/RNA non-specific endonuclease [Nocardia bovistercoris]MBH0780885.1 DNA/RNA non-specific endonuclease [Nocardia bovistercoris]